MQEVDSLADRYGAQDLVAEEGEYYELTEGDGSHSQRIAVWNREVQLQLKEREGPASSPSSSQQLSSAPAGAELSCCEDDDEDAGPSRSFNCSCTSRFHTAMRWL